MTAWGMDIPLTAWGMDIPCIIQRIDRESVLPVSSSRAKSRDLFRWRSDGECQRKSNGKHRIAGKVAGGASPKGLAKEEGKGGRKRFLAVLEMTVWGMDIPMTAWGNGYPDDSVGNGYPVHHTKNVWEKRFSRIVIPSEAEGSFSLAIRR